MAVKKVKKKANNVVYTANMAMEDQRCNACANMRYSTDSEVIQGVFLYELSNRFRCVVSINGENQICYMPSSCKITPLVDLQGKTVLLQRMQNSKLKFSVFAVKIGRSHCLLNLSKANDIIAQQLYRNFFSSLGKRKNIAMEKTVEGYRSDLYIEDTQTIVEVKTVLSFNKQAQFSSVYSVRAIKQLQKIEELLAKGYKVCYLIVALCPKVKAVIINENSPIYPWLRRCSAQGMLIYGISLHMKDGRFEVYSNISVDIVMNE